MGNDRRLVVILSSALGCALLAIAFLLGRVTTKPAETPRAIAEGPAPLAATAPTQPSLALPTDARSAPPAASTAFEDGRPAPVATPLMFSAPSREIPAAPGPGPGPVARTGSSSSSTPSPERQQIAAYFAEFERLDDVGSGDPQAFAKSMMDSITSGDFSSFNALLARARSQRERLRAIAAPAACVEHHRLALSLSNDSVAMMERLKTALTASDTTALMSISTEGHTLETQANQLKTLGETIKRQAGL